MSPVPLSLIEAARSGNVHGRNLAVFVELHEWLDVTEFRAVKAWHVADRLKMSERHVYRAIRILTQFRYLEAGDRFGNCGTFRIAIAPEANAA